MSFKSIYARTVLIAATVVFAYVPFGIVAQTLDATSEKTQSAITKKQVTIEEAPRLLNEYGEFRALDAPARTQRAATTTTPSLPQDLSAEDFNITNTAARLYATPDGARLRVEQIRTVSPSDAYSLLTYIARTLSPAARFETWPDAEAYVASTSDQTLFVKDKNLVRVTSAETSTSIRQTNAASEPSSVVNPSLENNLADNAPNAAERINALARFIAQSIEGEAGTAPVLLQHLPAWEAAQPRALYATTKNALRSALDSDSVLDVLDFSGGTEAATATYIAEENSFVASNNDSSAAARLVVVEHLTPQLAGENHRRVEAAINERRAANQFVPTVFRREGNYLVFVFNAPDEAQAARLADTVKYEQDVRWLGNDPFARQRAERAYTRMTLGLLLASLQTAGLGILLCITLGSVIGGYIFMRRRAQTTAANTYTEAGGMVRLNIDDLNDEHRIKRLSPAKHE